MRYNRFTVSLAVVTAISAFAPNAIAAGTADITHGETWRLYYFEEQQNKNNTFALCPNYIMASLPRYEKYKAEHPEKDVQRVVTDINMNLDKQYYTDIVTVSNPDDTLVLLNKFNKLPDGYVPESYNASDTRVLRLRPDAQQMFDKMQADAKADGISLKIVSGYRSYGVQKSIHSSQKYSTVDWYIARAGHSEHQTGLAVDINTTTTASRFMDKKEFKWLTENAQKYGFILRYPDGKEYLTGYYFEPWHWRYVGTEAAETIHKMNITFEEYHAMFLTRGSVKAQAEGAQTPY